MSRITNFDFESNLVRVVEVEGLQIWIGTDACRALGLVKPENALASLDEDEKYTLTEGVIGDGAGRAARIGVTEAGLYRLIFRSRKPEAERFKRWLAHEVLPTLRKTGHYGVPIDEPLRLDDPTLQGQPLAAKVGLLHFVMRTSGRDAAVAYMRFLGLPEIPAQADSEKRGEAENALARLLDHEINGQAVRGLIEEGLEGAHVARQTLAAFGIKISEQPEGFWIGSGCDGVTGLFADQPNWLSALRRVPGIVAAPRQSFAGLQSRASWVPLAVLENG